MMSEIMEKFYGGLGLIDIDILLILYRKERISLETRESYESYLKKDFPNEYASFLKYKKMVEKRTPNLKQIYFDWLDGKIDNLDFSLFSYKS